MPNNQGTANADANHRNQRLAGRTAIVTGASRGIGAAIVRELRVGGLDVYAVARSAEDLITLAQETGCRPMALDISHRDAVMSALGSLDADILVNNASAAVRGGHEPV